MNKRPTIFLALVLGAPALAQAWTVEGVDMNAVPWAELCPNVKAVELRTGAGSCPVVHPASEKHARWDGFGMGVDEPKPNCERLEREYRKLISPKLIDGKPSDNPAVIWGYCTSAFSRALKMRASQPERFSEPFVEWRERYFGGYLADAQG